MPRTTAPEPVQLTPTQLTPAEMAPAGLTPAEMAPAGLTPGEMAERTGTTIDTLRYYEREHLIVNVARAGSGHRRYSADDVGWVEVLRCLRLSGMSIEQLRAFSALAQQGRHTEPERLRLLDEHRATVQDRIAELAQAMTVIDHKIDVYRAALAEKEGL